MLNFQVKLLPIEVEMGKIALEVGTLKKTLCAVKIKTFLRVHHVP